VIAIDVDDREVQAAIKALRERIADLRPAFREIGSSLVDEIKLGFTDSKDPWGAPWAPLSERTQAMNKGRRRDGQPLLDTGKLRNSMTYRADKDSVSPPRTRGST
jgi:phage gpG-like protein